MCAPMFDQVALYLPMLALCAPMFDQVALYSRYVRGPYLGLYWHYVGLILAHVGLKVALCWPYVGPPTSGRGQLERSAAGGVLACNLRLRPVAGVWI